MHTLMVFLESEQPVVVVRRTHTKCDSMMVCADN